MFDGHHGPHRAAVPLMFAATRLPAVAAVLTRPAGPDNADDALFEFAMLVARDSASSTLGLAQLALAAHARAVGYDASAWLGHALDRARATLLATDPTARTDAPDLVEQIWPAAQAFSVAAKAIANDGMRVADELATGLGQTLVLFAITSEALDA